MSTNYPSLVSQTATLTVISSTVLVNGDNNFAGIFGSAIDYMEGRIYRDLDLPVVSVTDTSVTMSSGVRTISLSTAQGEPLAITSLNLFTPAGATSSNGTRLPLIAASQAVLDTVYPSAISANTGTPTYFCRLSNLLIVLGPTPDQAYVTEMIATTRPSPLSASNSSTWITQNLPELAQAAIMVFMAGHMRDFGAQADDPKMSQSWESQYQALLKTAMQDSDRQKFKASAWSAEAPSPLATPPRV